MGSLGRHQTVQRIGGNEQIHHKGKHENHQEKIGSQRGITADKESENPAAGFGLRVP